MPYVILAVLFFGFTIFNFFFPVGLWLSAFFSGVFVNPISLFLYRFRGVDPSVVIRNSIIAQFAKLNISVDELADAVQSGSNVDSVVKAVVAASRANIQLSFQEATDIDLAGRDVLAGVRNTVNPTVIRTKLIEAVAQDGIQVKAVCQITVRVDIHKLVGSAMQDTVLARVGEGVVSAIGRAETFGKVLENPDLITEAVLATGLDEGTAYEILSIDIMDVDVGENIGAKLQIDQAEADLKVAQAKAEQRRSEAKARQTEMRARVEEMKAEVVKAEAKVPEAMYEALANGRFSAMDYYKLENLIADTKMRSELTSGGR